MIIWNILRRCCGPVQQRFIVATMVLSGLAVQYIHRLAFNLAITEITYKLNVTEEFSDDLCKYNVTAEEKEKEKIMRHEEFHWTSQEQATVLGAFYIGYIVSHIPGGVLADKYGPKRVLGYGVILTSLCTLLTPVSARQNVYVVTLMRIVMGIAQGPVFPSLSVFNARWALPNERGLMSAYMSAGVVIGAIISNAGTGFLLSKLRHWDTLFYIYGSVTFAWFIVWFLFAHDSPSKHPFIGEKELQKLNESLQSEINEEHKKVKVPFVAMIKSAPVWAMVIGNCGNDWVFYVVITLLPQYMSYILHFNIVENGLINCLPYVAMICISISSAKLAELIITKKWMTTGMQRKVYTFICNMGPCLLFIVASFVGCNRVLAIVSFTMAMGVLGTVYSGVRVVNVDMAPNFAGTLMSLMNGAGCICGFLGPKVFAVFTEVQTITRWRLAFFVSTALVSVCTLIFLIWGSAEIQPWNFPASPTETGGAPVSAAPKSESKQNEDKTG